MIYHKELIQTDVEWLPEIPIHWQLKRLKDDCLVETGIRNTEDKLSEGEYPFFVRSQTMEFIDTYSFDGEAILTAGDGVGVAKVFHHYIGKFETHQRVYRISRFKKVFGRFLFYYLQENLYKEVLKFNAKSTVDSLRMPMFQRFPVLVPPYQEQLAIAQYLDTKTQALDKKINLLEKKIGYYKELRKSIINETVTKGLDKSVKLKDSGIDWIGQIPEHWEVKRFKDVVTKYTTGGTPSTSNNAYFNGDNIWITIGDIGESNFVSTSSLFLTDEAIKDANIVKTPKGSLLYSFKLSIGKMAFTTVDCYTNEAILSIFPNKNIDLMYYYMMLPIFMMLAATENIYGAKMLNQKLIANAFVLHPPKTEQTKIATYLDHKTQTIDKIVGNIQKQIIALKELRKTLINDVVTGKIKVVE